MLTTTKELASTLQVDYVVANALLRLLKSQGIAHEQQSRPNPSGKGKPTKVYDVPETVTINLNSCFNKVVGN